MFFTFKKSHATSKFRFNIHKLIATWYKKYDMMLENNIYLFSWRCEYIEFDLNGGILSLQIIIILHD